MANRKSVFFYALLFLVTGTMVGLVIASRFDLTSVSSAQTNGAPPMNSAPITGPLTATTFRDIAKNVTPAVVNIRTESPQRAQDLSLFERFFGQPAPETDPDDRGDPRDPRAPGAPSAPGAPGQGPRERPVVAAGTGFIIDKAGLILTNNHVVEEATKIEVSLYGEDDDQVYEARVVGRDELTDSALIELVEKPDHELPTVRFGDSTQMQPGDWVMAIGNPFGLAHTVSVGVISGNRPNQMEMSAGRRADMLQTDAAINPGNSGGPLLNLRGEVIGINTAIYSDGRQGNMGIGFAVPSNTVRELLPQLRTGKVIRGRIGVSVGAVEREAVDEFGLKNREGAVVILVVPGGPAAAAGVRPGDVILSYNGQPVRTSDDLVDMVTATKPGTNVEVRVMRDRQERTLNVAVEELDLESENNLRAGAGRGGRPDQQPQQETSSGFGLTMNNITPEIARRAGLDSTQGAVITAVEPDSPAARRGLQPGDIIVRVGGQEIATAADAQRELNRVPSGGTAFLIVLRGGQETFVTVTKD